MEKPEIVNYIKNVLETNKNGESMEIMRQSLSRYPRHFVLDDGNDHPFDTNYNERIAYYDGMEVAYQDILEKLLK